MTQRKGYYWGQASKEDVSASIKLLEGLPATRKFKSYVGLKGAENKLRKYLTEFQFTDIATAEKQIDWEKVPRVKILWVDTTIDDNYFFFE